jgi:hypothetical protein
MVGAEQTLASGTDAAERGVEGTATLVAWRSNGGALEDGHDSRGLVVARERCAASYSNNRWATAVSRFQ